MTGSYGSGSYGVGTYSVGLDGPTTAVPRADYVVLFTDDDLVVLGDPIMCWTSLDITLKFNEPDSGMMIVPGYPWILDQIAPGNRVVVIRNQAILTSGPIEKWLHERSDDGENAGYGKLTVNFADDSAKIAARDVRPDPAQTVEGQTVDNWTFTGTAEDALRALVNLNAGPGALADRREPHLVLGAAAGIGAGITVTAQRMQPLGDVARKIAEVGGNLGFRTRQVGTQIEFQVYAPVDKSSTVRFGFALGNMKYVSYEVSAPTATVVEVGGQGDTGADAFMIERTNPTELLSWGRFEKLVSRAGTADLQVLQDDGDKALAEGAATTRLATNVADTPDQRFGRDYSVGDIVAVESWPGEQVVDLVRTVHLQIYATSGEYVSATVGSQEATSDPEWIRRVREIDERLGQLERTVTVTRA